MYILTDLHLCAGQAKDMVGLVNRFAAKLEDKKGGALSEDEVDTNDWRFFFFKFNCFFVCLLFSFSLPLQTIQFKSYLLSVGIANPVTKYASFTVTFQHSRGSYRIFGWGEEEKWIFHAQF